MSALAIWTIYERPRDYPAGYVVRRWVVDGGRHLPDAVAQFAPTLSEARALVPAGLYRMDRMRVYDACIKEVWL